MSYNIFITRKIPEAGLALLRRQKNFRVRVSPHDRVLTHRELMNGVKGAHGILSMLTDRIDAAVLKAAGPQLKIVANHAVGVDNIDIGACAKVGVVVTATPGVLTQSVAEHTMALILAIAKRVVETDKFSRAGRYKGWAPMLLLGTELKGKILGLIGGGRIGSLVAEFANRGLGMAVVYSDVKANPELEKNLGAKKVSMQELMRESDVVSVHVPLLPTTRHLISKKEFVIMKRTAYLINTSRGPIVDEKALRAALTTRRIAGAAIDVWEFEPKLTPGLAKLDNIVITPHTASATIEARDAMAVLAAENIVAVLNGRAPKTPVA